MSGHTSYRSLCDLPDAALERVLRSVRQQQAKTFVRLSSTCKALCSAAQTTTQKHARLVEINGERLGALISKLESAGWWQLASLTLVVGEVGWHNVGKDRLGNMMQQLVASSAAAAAAPPMPSRQLPLRAFSMNGGLWQAQQVRQLVEVFPWLQLLELTLPMLAVDNTDKTALLQQQQAQLPAVTQLRGLTSLMLRTHWQEGALAAMPLPSTLVHLAWEDSYALQAPPQLSILRSLRHLSLRQPKAAMVLGALTQLTWLHTLAVSGEHLTPAWLTPAALAFLAPRLVDLEFGQITEERVDLLAQLTSLTRLTALRMPRAVKLVPHDGSKGGGYKADKKCPPATPPQLEVLAGMLRGLPSLRCLQLCACRAARPLISTLSACAALEQLHLEDADAGMLSNGYLKHISGLTRLHLSSSSDTKHGQFKQPKWDMTLQDLTGLRHLEVQPEMLTTGPAPHQWMTNLSRLTTLSFTRWDILNDGRPYWCESKLVPPLRQLGARKGHGKALETVVLRGWCKLDHMDTDRHLSTIRGVLPKVSVEQERRSDWWLRNTRAG